MFEIDLLGQIEKLKKEEELQLAEMRQRRLLEIESKKKEIERRNEEEEIDSLSKKESDLRRKLEEIRRKNFQLKVEVSSWESVAKTKTSELRDLNRILNECYGKIWSSREKFCDELDSFLDDFSVFARSGSSKMEYVIDGENGMEKLKGLKELIAFEENLEKILIKRQNELREEKEKLEESNHLEMKRRLEEWIQITRDRCMELNRRIDQKRALTDNKNFRNNQLFSIVNLEDVKKLTQI